MTGKWRAVRELGCFTETTLQAHLLLIWGRQVKDGSTSSSVASPCLLKETRTGHQGMAVTQVEVW